MFYSHSSDGTFMGDSPPKAVCEVGKPSRYKEDFIEQEQLGSGGFGTVHKVDIKFTYCS
jgi:hypothetical protein